MSGHEGQPSLFDDDPFAGGPFDDGLSWDEWFRALPLNPFEEGDDGDEGNDPWELF